MSNIKDAAKRVKALANQYQGVIELAAVIDEVVKMEGALRGMQRDAEANRVARDELKEQVGVLEAEVAGATNQLNKLKAEADTIAKDARAEAKACMLEAEHAAKEKIEAGEAAKQAIIEEARAEAKGIASEVTKAKAALTKKLKEVEAAKAELAGIEAKKLAALEELKKSLGL